MALDYQIPDPPPPPALTNPDNPIDRNVNAGRITARIAQQIHIRAPELLDLGQAGHAPVVLELLRPVRLPRHPVRHGRVDEPGRDAVDADAVRGPLHRERVGHVADAGLGGAVGGRGDALVGPVGGHAGGEDDGARDIEADEGARGDSRGVERAEHLSMVLV